MPSKANLLFEYILACVLYYTICRRLLQNTTVHTSKGDNLRNPCIIVFAINDGRSRQSFSLNIRIYKSAVKGFTLLHYVY